MRLATFRICLILGLFHASFAQASEIDSIRTIVTPVQCFGLRNGEIHVDSVFGGQQPYYYSLDGQAFSTNPTFDRLRAGEYTLYVRDALGVSNHWLIKVKEPNDLQVKLQVSANSVISGLPIDLRAIANVESEFLKVIEWQPADLFPQQDTLRQTVRIARSTEFFVVIEDQNGCIASDRQWVEAKEVEIYLPNVIKPGSDANAYFTVFSGEGVRRVVSLQIYSRVGSMVFERLDFQPNAPTQGWGGRWNGQVVQEGVYAYLAVVEFLDGSITRYEGTVTVVN